ncbi:hypothetical protein ACFQJD_11150 [Haloplanus sp. GCM10025708]|uniref:DUF7344 domain-containing protein n=1 Tax=Haloplanus sp. GCM10025708 TaxID=3252679 RepID=UPI00361D2292
MSATGSRERPTAESDATLAEGEIHDVLRNDRRRLVLERLRNRGGSETVAELAEFVAAVEAGTSPPPRNVRQSVYVSLHQTHLPKLDELGIVTYDPNEKTVSLAAGAERVAPYMDGGRTHRRRGRSSSPASAWSAWSASPLPPRASRCSPGRRPSSAAVRWPSSRSRPPISSRRGRSRPLAVLTRVQSSSTAASLPTRLRWV